MPLIALDGSTDGRIFDATQMDEGSWSSIWRKQTGSRLRCCSCDQPVHAKLRTSSGLRFFAHTRVVPDCPSQGETARHLELKARFAEAFRLLGWQADLEVPAEDWRADVLATNGHGRRIAVEVQLAPITPPDVQDRMRRHKASKVETLWAVDRRRPKWATAFATVVVDSDSRVIDTVLMDKGTHRPEIARSVSMERFLQRWLDGRLTPVEDRSGVWGRWGVHSPVTQYFQLDRCASAFIDSLEAQQRELEERRVLQERELALAKAMRAPLNEAMASSLAVFEEWYKRQTSLGCWFRRYATSEPAKAAKDIPWDPEIGIVILVGLHVPRAVFAIAEPHRVSELKDPRVAAWTAGQDDAVDTTGFAQVYTPESTLDLSYLKLRTLLPYRRRRLP